MTSFCIKRIMTDIASIQKDPIDKDKIFIYQNPENIFNVRVLMIGDEDTPYQYGMFYFYLVFPDNYPFSPPDMKFITSNGKTRFNPNLYISGKVCISLLNTWQGPKWTACNSLRSLLLSIKSMILGIKYPLENEPGYEITTEKKKNIDYSTIYYRYNTIIEYQVISHTIIKQYVEPPVGMEVFIPIVSKYLEENIHSIRNKIIELLSNSVYNKKYIFINYQNQSQYIDYETLLEHFDKTFAHYLSKKSEDRYADQYADRYADQYAGRCEKQSEKQCVEQCETDKELLQSESDEKMVGLCDVNSEIIKTKTSYSNLYTCEFLDQTETSNDNGLSNSNYEYNKIIDVIQNKIVCKNNETNMHKKEFELSEHTNLTVSLNNQSIIQMQIDSNNFIQQNVNDKESLNSYNYFEEQYKSNMNNEDSDVEFICVIPSCNSVLPVKIENDMNWKKENISDKSIDEKVSLKLDELEKEKEKSLKIDDIVMNQENYDSDEATDKIASKSKKCPGKSAKNYEDGTVMVSENDNRKYIVKSYIKKNYSKGSILSVNVKRWTLYKK